MKASIFKDITFEELYSIAGLKKLDEKFLLYLKNINISFYEDLKKYREENYNFSENYKVEGKIIIELAKILEIFIAETFHIQGDLSSLSTKFTESSSFAFFRKSFVNKKIKLLDISKYSERDFLQCKKNLFSFLNLNDFNEEVYIQKVSQWLTEEDIYKEEINAATIFGAFLFFYRNLYEQYGSPTIFFKAKKIDFSNLIKFQRKNDLSLSYVTKSPFTQRINRKDFNLYRETDLKRSLHNSNYCVKCHTRSRDYCKTGDYDQIFSQYKKNPLEVELKGCPLSMHISEMHVLNEKANPIAALSVAMINNPLLAGTGANICNDCSVSCIFQKQEAVDTPFVETEVLKQVLSLPWGFEIYSLLVRWNPLRFYRPYPKEPTNKNIFIVGLGPAGYSLAYNMAQEGHGVVIIDAIKLEPTEVKFEPIINYKDIEEQLEDRVVSGFGGVSEYGITSRWNKNYLKILRIIIERHHLIKMYGGIRFGSNIKFSHLEKLGFSHVALCTGSGKPNIIKTKNNICNGIRTASEFLMTLNLGAYKKNNLFSMQVRLPIIVLGAGLTAIDCATEALVYYRRQVEKIVEFYNKVDKKVLEKKLSEEEKEILLEYINHYELFQKSSSSQDVISKLGGVKIIYHDNLEKSQAFRKNSTEVLSALNQGVFFIEKANLHKINKDKYSSLESIVLKTNNGKITLPARTLLFATGTHPNHIIQQEFASILDNNHKQQDNKSNSKFSKELYIKEYFKSKRGKINISMLGDANEEFSGSVVKAMASAFFSQYSISKSMYENEISASFNDVINKFEQQTKHQIVSVKKLNENMYEIKVKSKLAAENFNPGQFFKMQNYEYYTKQIGGLKLLSEPVMLTGIQTDIKQSIITCVALKKGVSSSILENISTKDYISFTGPLGEGVSFFKNQKIILVGEDIANTVTISLAIEARKRGCEIIYIGLYSQIENIFYADLIKSIVSKYFFIVKSFSSYSSLDTIECIKGNSNTVITLLSNLAFENNNTRLYCSATSEVVLKITEFFKKNKGVINSTIFVQPPMFCGLKGVCSTCMQKNLDGSISYLCSKQYLSTDEANLFFSGNKFKQNSLQEKILHMYYNEINS